MNTFFTSDQHFDHSAILKFSDEHGRPKRPFAHVDEMNEKMIEAWNSVVRDEDEIWHLGDFSNRSQATKIANHMRRLRGKRKGLMLGNHDHPDKLIMHFEKIRLWTMFRGEDFIITHIPLREQQFRHKVKLCVHGHMHDRIIDDPRYKNVCVEPCDYLPVSMDVIRDLVKNI